MEFKNFHILTGITILLIISSPTSYISASEHTTGYSWTFSDDLAEGETYQWEVTYRKADNLQS